MHPDTSRLLAAERLADCHRRAEADALAGQRSAWRRHRLRRVRSALAPAYARRAAAAASAATGPRSGT